MIQALLILGAIFCGAYVAAKLVFSGAPRNTLIASVAAPVFFGFLAMQWGLTAADQFEAMDQLPTIAMIGLLLILGGLICGITIAIIGIIMGLARYRK